ncbi:hypothetical protein BH09BAC5_BH09BAC5_19020 [soil metagenome]
MKTIYLSLISVLLPSLFYCQNPLIFQPGPGLNNSTDVGGINDGKDAWVNETDYNFNGGAEQYEIAVPISDCNNTNTIAFFRYDLSGLPANPDSVFWGVTHYDHTTYCYSNCNADFYFAPADAAWDEQTVTYGNHPTWSNAFYGPINISFPNSFGLREYNITSMYNQWRNGTVPNNGFAVYSPTVGCNNACVSFSVHSSDDTATASRPYLKIYAAGSVVTEIISNLQITSFPNPANDVVNINAQNLKMEHISLFDLLGNKLSDAIVNSNSYQMDVSDLQPGVYFAQIYTLQGMTVRKIEIAR